MSLPSTSRSDRLAMGAGLRESVRHATKRSDRSGQTPALLRAAPLPTRDLHALRAWLVGSAALRPDEARRMLERAVDCRQLIDEPALHWRAVKARVAGDANWAPMGFKLVLD